MELIEFQNNLNRKWQKKIHHSGLIASFIILIVELVVFISYLQIGVVKSGEIFSYLLIRIALPSGINFCSLCITKHLINSSELSVESKNYSVCINILIICTITAAVHNFYFIIWMAPSIALFYATLFHSNRILTTIYIGTIFSAFISMTVNMIEGDFPFMVSISYCIFTIGLFTCGYYISRIIIKHHKLQLEYTYTEIENKQLLIERLDIEPMTKLYNRKSFDRNLLETVRSGNRIKKYNTKTVWLLIFDLDYFKSVNDTYGHLNGDKVLLDVASILKNIVGKDGRVYRYGGEEFAVLTFISSEEYVYEMAEKIRKEIEQLCFEFDTNKHITISAGISSYRENITPEEWIKNADNALYNAKRNGRNKIVIN